MAFKTVREKLFFTVLIMITLFSMNLSGQEPQWFKGQTHAHTSNSDADDLPRRAVRWYLDHEYNFLVITDHNIVTDIKYLDTHKDENFILIPGEEITDYLEKKPVHINGIDIKTALEPKHGATIAEILQKNIDSITAAGGLAQINHPQWQRVFADAEIIGLKNVKLIEIYNMNKDSNNFSAGGYLGMEEIWDRILSTGMVMYGVVIDDTHDYEGEFRPEKAYPGKGWIMVRAKELTPAAIVEGLNKGDFYGTVGVTLKDIAVTDKEYHIEIKPQYDLKYTTRFIGKNGELLKEEFGLAPAYTFKGNELYVRAKIICSSGDFAITQPVFPKKK
jgi:hypothetical protein